MNSKSILVVEDDEPLRRSICQILADEGYNTFEAASLSQALKLFTTADLILLDWRLPDGQGIDFFSKALVLRERIPPTIMLTARTSTTDTVLGLEKDAKDFITKPFDPDVLKARIRVQLRQEKSVEKPIAIGDLHIDGEKRSVHCKGEQIECTKKEFDLLFLLASQPKKVFARDEILSKVWGFNAYPSTRTVDTHILQLRQKLNGPYFGTIRGIGYSFLPQD